MTYRKTAARGAFAAALLTAAVPALATDLVFGSGSIALGTSPYTQNFNTLATGAANPNPAVTSNALPAGWIVSETGTNADTTYRVNSGADTSGDSYSYGAANATDRALGTLRSGALIPSFGAVFSNATGATITGLTFSFAGEQWRNGSASIDSLDFQYSLVSTNIADAMTSTDWISVAGLSFASPSNGTVGALDGNLAANRTLLNSILSNLTIASGQSFAIRWIDADPTGADDGLAIDDFSVSATTAVAAVPEMATWAMMIMGFGLIGFALRRRGMVKTSVSFA